MSCYIDLDSLFSIHFGRFCCTSIYSLHLSSLPSLTVLFFGSGSFRNNRVLTLDSIIVLVSQFIELDSLIMIEVENDCFENCELHLGCTNITVI